VVDTRVPQVGGGAVQTPERGRRGDLKWHGRRNCLLAKMPAEATHNVRVWHGTDQARCLLSRRYRGVSGLIADILRPPSLTQLRHPLTCRRRTATAVHHASNA
jgi:hypothetical protein